jgi:tetratricopeptide (TPR) repeat protein
MAKKGRPKKRKPAARPKAAPPGDLGDLADPRRREGLLRQLFGGAADDTPAGRAAALLEQAYEAGSEVRRLELARQALAAWPDCADAYVLLAEHAPARKDAQALYEQGVAAGERALGARAFQEAAGHFWGVLETRPYMRARLGLAHALWTGGRREEAAAHLQEMLRLNPNDNQGVRYTLAGWLLALDRDADLERLLQQYEDDGSAAWAYTRALLAFRKGGDTPEARELLKAAQKVNKHVPPYLTDDKRLPSAPPPYYSPGAESEAVMYAGTFLPGWKNTPGSTAWLRQATAKGKKGRRPAAPKAEGPLPIAKERLKKLPQRPDVWQVGCRQLPTWMEEQGVRMRPWLVLVVNETTDEVVYPQVLSGELTAAVLWDQAAAAMQKPVTGKPYRPTTLRVRPGPLWDELKPHLEEVGVGVAPADELGLWGDAYQGLLEHLDIHPEPSLLDTPGVTPELAGRFYEAAAYFYEQAPWRRVGFESAIKVECDRFGGGPWYVVVMGQSGMTFGLALYDDLEQIRRLWRSPGDDEENAGDMTATSVTFGDETEVPINDLEAAREQGWKVAGPEAYPAVVHVDPGMRMRQPSAGELGLLEACLRAVPDFVKRRPQEDPTREEVRVPAAAGEVTLGLSWVVEE